jgi:hypothetical protein
MLRRWFQFRLSTLLVLVTLAAVGADYWRRRSLLLERATEHARLAAESNYRWYTSSMPEPIQHFGRLEFHHRTLQHKYEWAAWIPWLPVAPDPPEPKRSLPSEAYDGPNIFRTETLNPGSSANVSESSP